MNTRPLLLLLCLAIFGGTGAVSIKLGVAEVPPLFFCGLRFTLAALSLAPLWYSSTVRVRTTRTPSDWGILFLGALFNLGNVAFFALGIAEVDPALSQLLYVLAPVGVYVVGVGIGLETRSQTKLVGVSLGVLGAGAAVYDRIKGGVDAGGVLLIVLAVLSFVGYLLFSKIAHRRWSSLDQVLAMSALVAIVMFILSAAIGESWNLAVVLRPRALLGIFGAGIIGSAAYYYLSLHIVKVASPVVASYAVLLQPVTAYFIGSLFFPSPFSWTSLLGALLAVLGGYLVLRPKKPNSAAP